LLCAYLESVVNAPTAAPQGVNTLLLLFLVAAGFSLLSLLVPTGRFAEGQPLSLASFELGPTAHSLSLFAAGEGRGFLNFLFEGLVSGSRNGAAVGVIALVFIIGGSFGVVQASGAVDRGLLRLIALTGGRGWLLLSALFIAFSLGGAVFGMGEETIAFLALLLPLTDRLGLPRASAVMCTYMASQIGFASSWMNPFSVVVAQGIAGLEPLSGLQFRLFMWSAFTLVGLGFTLRYAFAHRQPGQKAAEVLQSPPPLDWADRLILLSVLATVVWIVWGVSTRGYYLPEIAGQFFTLGLVVGVICWLDRRMGANKVAEVFTDGVRALVPVALVIAAAKGLLWLLGGSDPHQASVLNTLLFSMAWVLDGAPPLLAAQGMLAAQSVFNFFVTSGSAQAAITMPLMAGLGDLVGVSRQVSVLAFQLGDGLTNLVVPTSAVLIGAIGVAGLSWSQWLQIVWRFELLLLALAACFVAAGVLMGLS
jgi:uncharacterized ion transporter superfamily protein YfcC